MYLSATQLVSTSRRTGQRLRSKPDRDAGCSSASSSRSQSRAAGWRTRSGTATTTGTRRDVGRLGRQPPDGCPDQHADVAGDSGRVLSTSLSAFHTTSSAPVQVRGNVTGQVSATHRTSESFCTSRSPSVPGRGHRWHRRGAKQPKTARSDRPGRLCGGWPAHGCRYRG